MLRLAALAFLAILVLPREGGAQDRLVERPGLYLGLNMLVGGGAALVHALAAPEDPPLAGAFAKGAFGGVLMFGGQRLVATGAPALRLPGVQTVALGASLARNAGAGVPLLSELTFPLYPLYVRLRPFDERPVSVRLSAVGIAALGWAAASNGSFDAGLDWTESLLTGAPVFRSSASWLYPGDDTPPPACAHGDGCDGAAAGLHRIGTTWYTTGGRSPEASRQILTHESIHLTQFVRDAVLFGVPAGDVALRAAGGILARLGTVLAFDAFLPLALLEHGLSAALSRTPDGSAWRLYELEAHALTGSHDSPR